jgi:hypothetical protein
MVEESDLRMSRENLERPMPGAQLARLTGYALFLCFFALGATANGLRINFHGTLSTSSVGELHFWLGHAFLLFPASLLIGYGFSPQLGGLIHRVSAAADALTPRQRAYGVAGLTVVAIVLARFGHLVFLLGFPISDDEYAVEFGGRVLASGHVMAKIALPQEAIPELFLYFRNGLVGSFDWVGGQAVSALGELTGLGRFVWALVAAVPVPALAVLLGRRLGARWGLAAAIIFLCSPMAALLSMTIHSQLASRACFAVAILAFWMADRDGSARRWILTGALIGMAFLCRPLETAFFFTPFLIWAVVQTFRRDPAYRIALAGLVVGGSLFAILFFWHSYAMTGNPLLPARFSDPGNPDVQMTSLWGRFGDNVSYNIFMLAIWFLGPLGLILFAAGVLTDRFTKLLGIAVVADLCLAFFHDNSGLHSVGPIHYSELAVPLTIIATHGLANLVRGADRHLIDRHVVLAPVSAALVLGLGVFTFVQALALRNQAEGQRDIYAAIEQGVRESGATKAFVLAPWFYTVTGVVASTRDIGAWVHDWRRPRLDLSDEVIFLRDNHVSESLRARFPDRRFFRLQHIERYPCLVLTPLDGGPPIKLPALGTGDS